MAASSGDCALSEAPAPWRARRIYRLVIQLVGPVLLVFVLLHLQDVGAVLDALSWSDGVPLMAAMLLNALNYYFKVLRWDVLLAARGYSYSRLRAWTSFLSSGYVGLLTLASALYYVWFFMQFGISGEQLATGLQQISRYLLRMFV